MEKITRTVTESTIFATKVIVDESGQPQFEPLPPIKVPWRIGGNGAMRYLKKTMDNTAQFVITKIDFCERKYEMSLNFFIENAQCVEEAND